MRKIPLAQSNIVDGCVCDLGQVRKRAGRRLVIPQVESDEVESEENESSSEDEDSD